MVKSRAKLRFVEQTVAEELRLDLGTGKGHRKPAGFVGVDVAKHDGVDVVCNLGAPNWPWADNSVDEVHCDHVLHYLTAKQRVTFMNELWRVLKLGAQAKIIVPHWCAARAYLDLNVEWPPVTEAWFFTLHRPWREDQNSNVMPDLRCNFDHTLAYGMNPNVQTKHVEYQQFALENYKEAAQDIHVMLIKVA